MTTENAFDGTAPAAGSPIAKDVPNPNDLGGTPEGTPKPGEGETPRGDEKTPENKVDVKEHEELQSLVGTQGKELGELRKFFTDIAPVLDKLDKSPELVQAIIDGNITGELAKAAMEGKVKIGDAEIVTKAHEEVKRDLGKEAYKGATSEEIEKMVEEKATKLNDDLKKDFDGKLKERDELTAFEASVNEFVSRTPDFAKHASAIDKWLDDHDVTDIAVAYYAVKGELSEKEAQKQADIDKAEAEKNIALNAAGGQGKATFIKGDGKVIDSLIAGKSNPNVF